MSIIHLQSSNSVSALRWNKEKRYWKKFLDTFLHYGRSKMHWSDSYLANQLKVIKAVFNYLAHTRGYPVGNFQSSFVVHAWQPPPHVIMPYCFQWLIMHNNDFCKQLKPSRQTVLDTMIIGCTVGLRYKDLMALKPANLETTEIYSYLSLQTSKIGTMVRIPLQAYAVAILKKYHKKR